MKSKLPVIGVFGSVSAYWLIARLAAF